MTTLSHRIPLSRCIVTAMKPSKHPLRKEWKPRGRKLVDRSVVAILNFQNDHGNRFERWPRGAKKNVKFIQPPQEWATEEGLY